MGKVHKQRLAVLLFLWSTIMYMFYYSMMPQFHHEMIMLNYDLVSISSTFFSMSILFDKISLSFSCLVCYISGCVFMFARWYMKDDPYYMRFMWILLSFVMSMNILVFSGSALMLLLGWDGLGISSFALIIYYESKESLSAGFLTLLINRIGDVLIMSTMFFFVIGGSFLLVQSNLPHVLLIFCLAALTKSAQYPFSAWLPAAMAAPTPVSALVHSSTLVTAGIYILIRSFMSMNITVEVTNILLFCGVITSFIGGLCAIYENDIKKIVAYSTLSQLGVMVFSLGLMQPMLALFHLYTHALFKAMLFLVAGCMLMISYGVQDIRLLGGMLKNNFILMVFLNTSTLCLIGTPFLSAYYSKHAILSSMMVSNMNLFAVIIMIFATLFSSIYMIRLLICVNWGKQSSFLTNLPWSQVNKYFPLMLLYFGSLVFGNLYYSMDVENLMSWNLLSSSYWIVTSLMFIGIMVGLCFYKKGGVLMISNMFYMDPLWKSSNKFTYIMCENTKKIELGWIEPYNYLYTLTYFLNKFMYIFKWPKNTLNISMFSLIFIILIYYVSY